MESKAHLSGLQGLSKSYKTVLTQRLGVVAIGDANGFFFAQIAHDANNQMTLRLENESFARGNSINNFVEYKKDTFFLTIIDAG